MRRLGAGITAVVVLGLSGCVTARPANVPGYSESLLWAWSSGEKVQLFMGRPDEGSGPIIRLLDQVPQSPAAGL